MSAKFLLPTLKKAVLEEYYDIFYIIAHALGGVILQNQFYRWISGTTCGRTTASARIKLFLDANLIRIQPFFKNNLIVLSRHTLAHFGSNSSCKFNTQNIMRSALVMESLLDGRGKVAPAQLVKELNQGAIACRRRPIALALVYTLQNYLDFLECSYPEWDTMSLQYEYQRMGVRAHHAVTSLANPAKAPLPLDTTQPDLFILEIRNMSIRGIEMSRATGELTLHVYLNYYDVNNVSTYLKAKHIIKAIFACEAAFDSRHSNQKVLVHIDIFSHYPANRPAELRLRQYLSHGLALQHRPDEELDWLTVHWLDTSKRFFSGIPIDRLK